MQKEVDIVASLLIVTGSIVLIVCGVFVAKPNLHGAKFAPGLCTITASENSRSYDDMPKCSCGKNCKEEYPCLVVYAAFQGNGTQWDRGTIHANYGALKEGCVYKPSCSKYFSKNAMALYNYFVSTIVPLVDYDYTYPYFSNVTVMNYTNNTAFPCWGHDNKMYIDNNYTALKAYLALGIPAGAVLLGFLMTITIASKEQRECTWAILSLPCVIVWVFVSACIEECCKKENQEEPLNDLSSLQVDNDPSEDSTATPYSPTTLAPPYMAGTPAPVYTPHTTETEYVADLPPPPSYNAAVAGDGSGGSPQSIGAYYESRLHQ